MVPECVLASGAVGESYLNLSKRRNAQRGENGEAPETVGLESRPQYRTAPTELAAATGCRSAPSKNFGGRKLSAVHALLQSPRARRPWTRTAARAPKSRYRSEPEFRSYEVLAPLSLSSHAVDGRLLGLQTPSAHRIRARSSKKYTNAVSPRASADTRPKPRRVWA